DRAAAALFLVLAAGLLLAHTQLAAYRSTVLGITGLLTAAFGATGFIAVVSTTHANFIGAHTSAGFFVLGLGIAAFGWDITEIDVSEPRWVPIGACLFLFTIRMGLWIAVAQDHSPANLISILTLLGGILSPMLFGLVVHLGLKTRLVN